MPVIHYHYIHDMTIDQKKKLVDGITKAVNEVTGIPSEHVQIWMNQTSHDNHAIGGLLLDDFIAKSGK